jgi:CRISPR-associated protein Csx3
MKNRDKEDVYMINFFAKEFEIPGLKQKAVGVHFQNQTIEPEFLRETEPPRVDGCKGLVLSGRGPIWLYGFLIHHYHPHPWIATYEPRYGIAVVVESHIPDVSAGDTLAVPEEMRNLFETT